MAAAAISSGHAWEVAKAKRRQAIADQTAGRLTPAQWEKSKKDFEKAARAVGKNPAELLIFGNSSKARFHFVDWQRKDGTWEEGNRPFPSRKDAQSFAASQKKEKDAISHLFKKHRIRSANPSGGFGNHKPGCKCPFCKRQRDIEKKDAKMPKEMRDVMSRNPKGKAKLTPEEDRAWVKAFEFYVNEGKTDSQADKLATRDVKKEFPRLRAFKKFAANPKRATPRKRRKDRVVRRNPSETEEAVRLFESFHGKDPKEIAEKHVSAAMRLDYAALGDLMKLRIKSPLGELYELDFEGEGVKLASSPDGKQLYCIGGRQNIEKCLDADSLQKDFIDLGECVRVEYFARKVHSNFQPITYYHKMGEKTGDRPTLMYDKLRKQIFFIGGAYHIDKDKGISPGIEN